MINNPKSCALTVEFEEVDGEVRAFCPELNLMDHGATAEEAEAQLMKSIWLFMQVCADQGTLYKVLGEKGALKEDAAAAGIIQLPIPLHLFSSDRVKAE